MVKEPLPFAPSRTGAIPEKLVVRWCSRGKTSDDKADSTASTSSATEEGQGFTGLFIFQFDSEGRILSHTIEHVQEGGAWEKGVGAKFVDLTDRLLGGIKGSGSEGSDTPLPACQRFTKDGVHRQ
jgi:Mitochondrial protein up-regulated during meiosis